MQANKFGNPFSFSTSSMHGCQRVLLLKVTGSIHGCLLGLPQIIAHWTIFQEGYDMGYNGVPPYYNTYGGSYHPPPPPLPHLMGGADPRYAAGNPYLGGQQMQPPESPSMGGQRQPPRNHPPPQARTNYATLGNRPYSPNANGTRSGTIPFLVCVYLYL